MKYFFSLFTLLILNFQVSAEEAEQQLPVHCRAIDIDNRRRTNNPGEEFQQVQLIVLGQAKLAKKGKDDVSIYEIKIDEVLFGSCVKKTVLFSGYWNQETKAPEIFALRPTFERLSRGTQYTLKYSMEAKEIDAMASLGKAMLSHEVLSSKYIFIGQEHGVDKGGRFKVEVKSVIHGKGLTVGARLEVNFKNMKNWSDSKPLVSKKPAIYFISDFEESDDDQKVVYHSTSRLPVEMEPNIELELKSRKRHPVVEREIDGKKVKSREVFFKGTHEQAIAQLSTNNEAALYLAMRFLEYTEAKSKDAVMKSILAQYLSFPEPKVDQFNQLKELISVYANFKHKEMSGELIRLAEGYIDHVESGALDPPAAKRRLSHKFHRYEENRCDVNHSLTWILDALPRGEIPEKFLRRLLMLRDRSAGQWRAEIQLALDVKSVEDDFELEMAMGNSLKIPVVRLALIDKLKAGETSLSESDLISTYFNNGETVGLECSADGKHVYTHFEPGFVDVRDASKLTLIRRNKLGKDMHFITFCPDGSGVYITAKITARNRNGGIDKYGAFSFLDVKTGKTLSTFNLPVNWNYRALSLNWLPRSKLLILHDGKWFYLNYSSGEVIENVKLGIDKDNDLFNANGISNEDGSLLYSLSGGGKSTRLDVVHRSMDRKQRTEVGRIDLNWGCWCNDRRLVPDGKSLYFGSPGIYIHDRKTLKLISGNEFRNKRVFDVKFSKNGKKYVAVVGNHKYPKDDQGGYKSIYKAIIRVHDTYTGATLFAFDQGAAETLAMTFGQKGRKLYILKKGGVLEMREMPQ